MKKGKSLICLLLSLVLLWQTVAVADAELISAAEANDVQTYYVTPELSEGMRATKIDPASLFVKGTLSDGFFMFSEDRTLTFSAAAEDGWTYNAQYTRFFEGDRGNRSIEEGADGEIRFTYRAKKGNRIPFEDLAAVWVNATADRLPQLQITIDGSFSQITKDKWTAASFELTSGSKQFASGNHYSGKGEIKGRGNSSWEKPQKPYSIKLKEKASLLGIPKTKKYAIVASYSDASMMRNYITYKSALSLVGMKYTPKIEFVEVYLNGAYNGIYALVERIDIESTKVDIEEATPDNLTGGYIIEKDAGDKVDKTSDPWFRAPFQANPNEDLFTLKAPDVEPGMLEYLEEYMQKLHDALMGNSGESYTDYIDVSSWADFLIMQEISKNVDGNLKTSCYFVKERDNNVLRMDALWDFDLAYGVANWHNGSQYNNRWDCPTGTGTDRFMVINSSCPWFQKLYSIDEFNALVKQRYSQYRAEMIPNMKHMIYEQAAYLSKAAESNTEKWPGMGSFSYGVSALDRWLDGRIQWLDGEWLNQKDQTLELNVKTEGDGAGTVENEKSVVYGDTALVKLKPEEGSEVTSVLWNGIDVTAQVKNNELQTPIMTTDTTLTVTFARIQLPSYSVTINPMENGSVTADRPSASAGETVTLTVSPNAEYRLAENGLQVNGGAVALTKVSDTKYTFTMPSGNVTVSASFVKVPVPAVIGVTISPKQVNAKAGETISFHASVQIENGAPDSVEWRISGAHSEKTTIDADGKLLIAEDETAEEIIVTAISRFNAEKYDQSFVQIQKEVPSKPDTSNPNTGDYASSGLFAVLALAGVCLLLQKRKDRM